MSSVRVTHGYKFTCDCCGLEWVPPRPGSGSEPREWSDCWQDLKEAGWRAVKVRSSIPNREEWENRCPDCA